MQEARVKLRTISQTRVDDLADKLLEIWQDSPSETWERHSKP
jgi:hypothetical protein